MRKRKYFTIEEKREADRLSSKKYREKDKEVKVWTDRRIKYFTKEERILADRRDQKKYREKNKEKIRIGVLKWSLNNKDRVKLSHEKYRKSKKGKIAAKRNRLKYRINHADRDKATQILRYNVGTGKIIKPDECSKCGIKCVTQGHHNDYSKPLEVSWLCHDCHTIVHVGLRRIADKVDERKETS